MTKVISICKLHQVYSYRCVLGLCSCSFCCVDSLNSPVSPLDTPIRGTSFPSTCYAFLRWGGTSPLPYHTAFTELHPHGGAFLRRGEWDFAITALNTSGVISLIYSDALENSETESSRMIIISSAQCLYVYIYAYISHVCVSHSDLDTFILMFVCVCILYTYTAIWYTVHIYVLYMYTAVHSKIYT